MKFRQMKERDFYQYISFLTFALDTLHLNFPAFHLLNNGYCIIL